MAEDLVSFYNGDKPGNVPGLLPDPYYCASTLYSSLCRVLCPVRLTIIPGWEAGAMMGSLIDYWYYTGDTKYNDLTTQGLLFQVGPNADYMPPNQTLTEGNDDQGFWGMAVMTAAEYNFPNPPATQPQWLALAQAVFNTQAARWETADCNGGLRWQIFIWNNGYTYKNSISQACFFNLAARLALYTQNKTYSDWAVETWDWMVNVKLLNDQFYIYDGAHIETNCTQITPYQWTYNAGAFLLGAAAMYNYTSLIGDQDSAALWKVRVDSLLNATDIFFTGANGNIMFEVACETVNLCDLDQQSFKAYLSRWMAATTKWAPWTASKILPLLQASSVAAASQCTGGDNGRMCGLRWTDNGKWDGTTGVGQQMAAMEVTLANIINDVVSPVTNGTGGTSQGDPTAGGSDIGRTDPYTADEFMRPITTGDRVGAGILTALFTASLVAGVLFVLIDESVDRTPKERLAGFVVEVGKNSRRLVKRGGLDAAMGEAMTEKGKFSGVASFRVIDCTHSDRSSGSMASNDGLFGQRQNSIRIAAEATASEDFANDAAGKRASHHSFFSPAHFRQHSAGTSSSLVRALQTRPNRASAPEPVTSVEYPATAVTTANTGDESSVQQPAGTDAAMASRAKHGSHIKRKPVSMV